MQRATLEELPVVWRGSRPPGSVAQLSAPEGPHFNLSSVNQIIPKENNGGFKRSLVWNSSVQTGARVDEF